MNKAGFSKTENKTLLILKQLATLDIGQESRQTHFDHRSHHSLLFWKYIVRTLGNVSEKSKRRRNLKDDWSYSASVSLRNKGNILNYAMTNFLNEGVITLSY